VVFSFSPGDIAVMRKSSPFDAAVVDALEELGQTFDEHLRDIDDPRKFLVAGLRLSARMPTPVRN